MALQTYAELQSSIQNWIAKSDARFTGVLEDLISLAEMRIFKELKVRQMEAAFDETIATGMVAVPDDYIRFKVVYVNASPIRKLIRTDLETLYTLFPLRSSYGQPSYIARNAGNFEFGPFPDNAYEITGTYYANPVSLSDSVATNTIFPKYADVYLWAALTMAAPFLSDTDMIATWEGMYGAALGRANKQDKDEAYSGSLIQPKAI